MEDLTKLLQDDNELNEDQVKRYLAGNISDNERHEVEQEMASSPFLNDAIEGLETISDQKLNQYVDSLNKDLHQYLEGKRDVKGKRKIKELSWIIIAVIVILVLCIIGYFVVRLQ